ncbi:mutator type transposase [Tanacetum coccineum]|uniref:Mutator type transposase n=1 Tax=Tanacetum coccineum TaxID=301880 RepID=A0ABQ5EM16_9ASTR
MKCNGIDIADCFQVLGTGGELDAFVSIPDEGDMAFLRKKVKSGAAVGKRVFLQMDTAYDRRVIRRIAICLYVFSCEELALIRFSYHMLDKDTHPTTRAKEKQVKRQLQGRHISLLREYAQELINQNPGTIVRIDVQQEPNPESMTRTFRRVCQILITVGVDANNGMYPVAYAIVEAESKASWCWFLSLLGEDLGIEANFNYTFISDRQKAIHENMKSQFKGGVYKEMLWNAAKATSIGRAKCDLPLNNICKVFNRQLLDGKDQPIITCLEYIIEYLMKRIVVVQKVIAKTVGPLTPSVHAAYRLETWAHVYLFKVNLCNGREIWLEVEATTVIAPPLYKPQVSRPPKKRKKSHDEVTNESCSSGKLSRKGKSVRCGKCGNVGHNMKGYRGQGGATQAVVQGLSMVKVVQEELLVQGMSLVRQVQDKLLVQGLSLVKQVVQVMSQVNLLVLVNPFIGVSWMIQTSLWKNIPDSKKKRLEEEMRELRQSVIGLRGVVESFITEQTRVSTWMISCMTQLMDASGRTYQAFDSTLVGSSRVPYQRRVIPRTGDASTSAPQQLDP